jgi:hypothetical protein
MTDRSGHLLYGTAFAEFLKAAHSLDMKLGVGDIASVIQSDCHLGMAFDPGYRLNINYFAHVLHLLI